MAETKNSVYIGTSIDGYIADKNGGIDWLHAIPNPENIDMGYTAFMQQIDALVMGRNTFETILGFDIDWPYKKPVFVLSNSLKTIPEKCTGRAYVVNGSLLDVLSEIHGRGFNRLYIDGGRTIQSFLAEDLIDEMIITYIPILLGGGIPLFGQFQHQLKFECTHSEIFLDKIVQNHFKRTKNEK
jgi:dihydrofolate reductase